MEEGSKMKKSIVNQVALCCLANLALLGSGMSLGFTAVALPYMKRPDSTLPIDDEQASWIASLASVATPVGCLMSGHLLDRFGRKVGLLIISVPLIIGWLLIGINPTLMQISYLKSKTQGMLEDTFGQTEVCSFFTGEINHTMLKVYAGRICTGVGTGLCSIPATVYTAEVADSSIRGLLVTGTSVSIALGVVIVYTLGAILKERWQLVALICSTFPAATFVLVFFFLPESPVWLVAKNRIEDASNSLMRINRATTPGQVKEELQTLAERTHKNQKRSMSFTTTLKALTRPESYKPLFIMNTFFFFQQITGTFVVIFYAVDVVLEAGIKSDPFKVTVMIGLTRLIFTFLAAYLAKILGRRPTAILSGVSMAISLLTLATHLYLIRDPPAILLSHANDTDLTQSISLNITQNITQSVDSVLGSQESVSYIPISMLLLYILGSTIGFLTLPWSMIGEVYPAHVRGVAGGLTTCVAYGISFFVLKMYPHMKDVLDKHGVFYFFGTMSCLGTLFVVLFLPETEGKTLREIEEQFSVKKRGRHGIQAEEEVSLQNTKKATIVKSSQR